jgi:hypothetical protein
MSPREGQGARQKPGIASRLAQIRNAQEEKKKALLYLEISEADGPRRLQLLTTILIKRRISNEYSGNRTAEGCFDAAYSRRIQVASPAMSVQVSRNNFERVP